MHRRTIIHAIHRKAGFTLIELLLVLALTTILIHSMSLIFKSAIDIINVTDAEKETRQTARNIFSRLRVDLQGAMVDERGNYFTISNGSFTFATTGRTCSSADLKFVTTTTYNPERLQGRMDITQLAYTLMNQAQSDSVRRLKLLPEGHSEAPLLVRYALAHLTRDNAQLINSDLPAGQRSVAAYEQVRLDNPNAALENQQYVDIVSGNVLDFRVDWLDSAAVVNLSNFELSKIDSYWLTGSYASSNTRPLPQALRISITLADTRRIVERSFESFFPIRFTKRRM